MRSYLLTTICLCVGTFGCFISLWILSYHFIQTFELAMLFFPLGLKIGLTLHTKKKYWLAIYLADMILILVLFILNPHLKWQSLVLSSLVSIPILKIMHVHYKGTQLKKLTVIFLSVLITSFFNVAFLFLYFNNFYFVFLCSFTGGIMIAMSSYLVYSYLFENRWEPLTPNLVYIPINFKIRNFIFYLSVFIASIYIQIGLPIELRQFSLFCSAIPIIFFAYNYGWQGALLATLFNSIALMVIQTNINIHTNLLVTDILLSLLAQTLTGILLGLGVEKLKEINLKLRNELEKNKNLTRNLLKIDEEVRRDIARELHDEIGQNITAIRLHANMIQRNENILEKNEYAEIIEDISYKIYETTHGLLNKLRPKSFDEFTLREVVLQLINDLHFSSQKIKISIHYDINDKELNDIVKITLFRIIQESLNNIIKHAKASKILLSLSSNNKKNIYELIIIDNGIGFYWDNKNNGFGLLGIRERVEMLDGIFNIENNKKENRTGAKLKIIIPRR